MRFKMDSASSIMLSRSRVIRSPYSIRVAKQGEGGLSQNGSPIAFASSICHADF